MLDSVAGKLTQITDNLNLVPDDLVTDSGDGRPNFHELLIWITCIKGNILALISFYTI